MVEDACVHATYTVNFPGSGEAPAHTTGGTVEECDVKLFADVEINTEDKCVKSIKSYSVRSGHDEMSTTPELSGDMKNIDTAGMRKALKEILESVMAGNVKVQVNKSVQDIEATCTSV